MASKKQSFVLATALLILSVGLFSGCTTPKNDTSNGNGTNSESENEPFVGQWMDKDSEEILIFRLDGTLVEYASESTYRVEGSFIYFNEGDPYLNKTARFVFEGDDVLKLSFLLPKDIEGIVMTLLRITE